MIDVPYARYQRRWCVVRTEAKDWVAWRGGNYMGTHQFFATHERALGWANQMAARDHALGAALFNPAAVAVGRW